MTVDSTFLVGQARRALSQAGVDLEPTSIRTIAEQGIQLGVVISMAAYVRGAPIPGGGGLVWVDFDSACATVLRRYE